MPWMECFNKDRKFAQARPVCSVGNGFSEPARSIAALEAHFLGDVALAFVEVARPDAAVFVGEARQPLPSK